MFSQKALWFAYLLLVGSLSLVVTYGTLAGQLTDHVSSRSWSVNGAASRPMSTCGSNVLDSSTLVMQERNGHARTCPMNFSLSLSQANLIQVQGSTSLVQAFVSLTSGNSAQVTVSAQGIPAATEILFAPTSGRPSFATAMTIASSAGTPLGQFNITILATGGGLQKSATLSFQVVPIVHNVAVVSASVQGTAIVGSVVLINATVANYGSLAEDLELRASANSTLVSDQVVSKLAPTATYIGQLVWNTTGFSPGTYAIIVAVPPIQGEKSLSDNIREAGQILLTQSQGPPPASPSPAASGGNGPAFIYGRQLAIVAGIAEAAIVFLIVLRRNRKSSTRNSSDPRSSRHSVSDS